MASTTIAVWPNGDWAYLDYLDESDELDEYFVISIDEEDDPEQIVKYWLE